MKLKMLKNGNYCKGEKQHSGREILMAMGFFEEDLVQTQVNTGGEKQHGMKKSLVRKVKWAVAAACSLCLIGGGVVFAASRLKWHVEKYVDTNDPQPDYSRYWVDFSITPVPVDMIQGSVREVENIFKEEAANGIYPPDGCPRGFVMEEFETEREAIDYIGYEGLRETMLPDWKNWHSQLVAYGDKEGNLIQVRYSNSYKVGEKIQVQTNVEIFTENWSSEIRSVKMPFEDRASIQGKEYITKNGKTGLLMVSDSDYQSDICCQMEGFILEDNIVYSIWVDFNGSLDEKSGVAEEAVTKVMHDWMDQF
ncbi:MAG: hypothetical protein K2N63_12095 [Lachnospiraceae bacterium]|nr:hypothetical protein [Lachnospiraceae bacterium]